MVLERLGKMIIGLVVVALLLFGLTQYGRPALERIIGYENQIPMDVQTSEERQLYEFGGQLRVFESLLVSKKDSMEKSELDSNLKSMKESIEKIPADKLKKESIEKRDALLKDIGSDYKAYDAFLEKDLKKRINLLLDVSKVHSNPEIANACYADICIGYMKLNDYNKAKEYYLKVPGSILLSKYSVEIIEACKKPGKCEAYNSASDEAKSCRENLCFYHYDKSPAEGTGCWYEAGLLNNKCQNCEAGMACESYGESSGACEKNPCRDFSDFDGAFCKIEGSKCVSSYCCAERVVDAGVGWLGGNPSPVILSCKGIPTGFRLSTRCTDAQWELYHSAEASTEPKCDIIKGCKDYVKVEWCNQDSCDVGPKTYANLRGCYNDGAVCNACKERSLGMTCEDYGTSQESCDKFKKMTPCSGSRETISGKEIVTTIIKGEPCRWDGSKCLSQVCCVMPDSTSAIPTAMPASSVGSGAKIVDCAKIPSGYKRCDNCCSEEHWLSCLDEEKVGMSITQSYGTCENTIK